MSPVVILGMIFYKECVHDTKVQMHYHWKNKSNMFSLGLTVQIYYDISI